MTWLLQYILVLIMEAAAAGAVWNASGSYPWAGATMTILNAIYVINLLTKGRE